MEKSYLVAEHCFTVQAPETVFKRMKPYEPFITDTPSSELFRLSICQATEVFEDFTEDYRQKENQYCIVYGHTKEKERVFQFFIGDELEGWLICSEDFFKGVSYLYGPATNYTINDSLIVMYSFSTAPLSTLFFHSAVVSYKGQGYLFLGKSGTGKSTHAQLWLKHIEGAELVNDDKPIVRIWDNGNIIVYGSPWSGKTPCYRQINYPVGGIVLLKQAPYNKIQRVKGMDAFMIIKRCTSSMRWVKRIADGLHYSENLLAQAVPVWFLECLPNEAAARLCQSEIAYEG